MADTNYGAGEPAFNIGEQFVAERGPAVGDREVGVVPVAVEVPDLEVRR